jgi:CheY-like chemotaxis protein
MSDKEDMSRGSREDERSKTITVLILDDEEEFAEVLENYVLGFGFRPIVINSAKDAIRVLQSEKIDIIVIDSVMPEHSGLTVIEKIRAQGMNQPAVFCSGYPPEWIGGSIHNLNIIAFLEKQNLQPGQLLRAIESGLRRK